MPLCFGQQATIVVGSTDAQDDVFFGTEGPDVIVMDAGEVVWALGGDDVVCVNADAEAFVSIVHPGPGNDRVWGNHSGNDLVFAQDEAPGEADRDTIETGGAMDFVQVGSAVLGAGASEDVVRLGRGRDVLEVYGDVSAAHIDGGPQRDAFIVYWERFPVGGSVSIDNRREEFVVNGTVVGRWNSLERFGAVAPIRGPFSFRGSMSREYSRSFSVRRRWNVDVRMGGGNDWMSIRGGAAGSVIDGGSGPDWLQHKGTQDVDIYGRGGHDRLVGGRGGDNLFGGRGYDRADGGDGIDRCKAELRVRCGVPDLAR